LTLAVLLVAFGVVLAVQHRTEASVPRLVQEHKPVPCVRPHDARPSTRERAVAQGKTYVVNFLELVVHPVPPGSTALQTFLRRARRCEPDFAMIGIVRDDGPGCHPRLRRHQRGQVAGGL